MRPINPHTMPPHMQRALSEKDRKALNVVLPEEAAAKNDAQQERDLQAQCENYLRLQGFWPRTPEWIAQGRPPKGWYIHLHEAKRNPILLDLLILRNDGRYLEIELKSESGVTTSEQRSILDAQCMAPVRSLVHFINGVKNENWWRRE